MRIPPSRWGNVLRNVSWSDHSGGVLCRLRPRQQDHGGRGQGPAARGRSEVREYFVWKYFKVSKLSGTVCWVCPGWSGGSTCRQPSPTTSVMTSTVLYCTVMRSTVLYCTKLYFIMYILYYIIELTCKSRISHTPADSSIKHLHWPKVSVRGWGIIVSILPSSQPGQSPQSVSLRQASHLLPLNTSLGLNNSFNLNLTSGLHCLMRRLCQTGDRTWWRRTRADSFSYLASSKRMIQVIRVLKECTDFKKG